MLGCGYPANLQTPIPPASRKSLIIVLTAHPLQDILTDDEIISDSFDLKEIDGIVYEADCAMITEEAVNVGMFDLIFNPAAHLNHPQSNETPSMSARPPRQSHA